MPETEHAAAQGRCEVCRTSTPEEALSDVQTPSKRLTVCPSCRPDRPADGLEGEHD